MKNFEAKFDTNNIQSVELNLLDGQVEILLRALELYAYNLDYMLNVKDSTSELSNLELIFFSFIIFSSLIFIASFNSIYMVNSNDDEISIEQKQEKTALLKYTYEQVLATQAEQVVSKRNNMDNIPEIGKSIIKEGTDAKEGIIIQLNAG